MTSSLPQFKFIDKADQLDRFYQENKSVTWMGFDTEFIGEKRFHTLLCLIQVVTKNGIYVIDSLKLRELDPFISMITNPDIVKITHAGDNDYRLLNQLYNIIPSNTFDTQIAAGFVGYKYPISFQKLVENEIGVRLKKGYTVSDWESRPINDRQLKYALDDVIYLEQLWNRLSRQIEKLGRTKWLKGEQHILESEAYYEFDPYKEALSNSLILGLRPQDQVFLIRVYKWRREEAARKDHSKEMVLPNKFIGPIVRHISSGREALKGHRRIPDHIIRQYWNTFRDLREPEITEEEQEVLNRVPDDLGNANGNDLSIQILHLLAKFKCQQQNIAPELVLNPSRFKRMKNEPDYMDEFLLEGWRYHFLGEQMVEWLQNRDRLEIRFEDGGRVSFGMKKR